MHVFIVTLISLILSLTTEKLVSLLPEYVVPYMIHLLAHDPDFTKPQEYDQLKDIKESVLPFGFVLATTCTKKMKVKMTF